MGEASEIFPRASSKLAPSANLNGTNEYTDNTTAPERLLKLLVVGDYAVGKTSLVRRYCDNVFSESYRITIGVEYHDKVLPERSTRVQLWDVAGHERFGNMTRTYFKYAVGAYVVFDMTRPASMEGTLRWYNDIKSKIELPNGRCIPTLLVGNKIDALPEEDYASALSSAAAFAQLHGFVGFEAVSAKTSENVPSGLDRLLTHVDQSMEGVPMLAHKEYQISRLLSQQRSDLVELRDPNMNYSGVDKGAMIKQACCGM